MVVQLMLQESGFRTVPFGTIWGDPDLFHGIPSEKSGLGVRRVGNERLNVVVRGRQQEKCVLNVKHGRGVVFPHNSIKALWTRCSKKLTIKSKSFPKHVSPLGSPIDFHEETQVFIVE